MDPDLQLLEVAERYGLATRTAPGTRCNGCGRVYWPGTHRGSLDEVTTRVHHHDDRSGLPPHRS